MKKHDEGYALPFVLVVMTVLIIIALGVMGYAQRNLEAQKDSIVRMQEKYAAAGPIEQILAAAENGKEASFPKSEILLFNTQDRYLRVASAKTGNSDIWVIAEMAPTSETGSITGYFAKNGEILTIKGKVTVTEYRIVDKTTALQFVAFGPSESGETP